MRWPWQRRGVSNSTLSVSDPALLSWLGLGVNDVEGIPVGETSALSNSAMFRGVSLIAGTLAGLPFRSWMGEGLDRKTVRSIFDDPDPDGQTPFEWKETAFAHLVLHGRCGALKQRTEAGGLARLQLVHPLLFSVEEPTLQQHQEGKLPVGGLWFRVQLADGRQETFDARDFWYVPSLSTDGALGRAILTVGRQSVGTTLAGDKAAAKAFGRGISVAGIATPSESGETLDPDELKAAKAELLRAATGAENAGGIALINRSLSLTPWTVNLQQAQFLESRQFQIEEVSRWTGVPPHLLMQTEKQTSWGTGVDEQNRGLSKFVLGQWANRFEQRASRLLPSPRWVEFDFAGLERPNFATQVGLVLQQVEKRLISEKYARELLGIPESAAPEGKAPDVPPAP